MHRHVAIWRTRIFSSRGKYCVIVSGTGCGSRSFHVHSPRKIRNTAKGTVVLIVDGSRVREGGSSDILRVPRSVPLHRVRVR